MDYTKKGLVFCFVSTNYHPADRNNVRERETGNATNLVDRVENTKLGARGVTEIILPIVHGLRRVQHGSKKLRISIAQTAWRSLGFLPIVTSRGRADTQNRGVKVQHAHSRVSPPFDLCELRSLRLRDGEVLLLGSCTDSETHHFEKRNS